MSVDIQLVTQKLKSVGDQYGIFRRFATPTLIAKTGKLINKALEEEESCMEVVDPLFKLWYPEAYAVIDYTGIGWDRFHDLDIEIQTCLLEAGYPEDNSDVSDDDSVS